MKGVFTYPSGVLPAVLGQIYDRANTSKDAALLGSYSGLACKELSLKAKSCVGRLRRQNRKSTETGEYTACSRFIAKQIDHISRMAAV